MLYFSDGTLEVDDDTEEIPYEESESKQFPVNPVGRNFTYTVHLHIHCFLGYLIKKKYSVKLQQELTWFPWMWYQTVTAGSKALEVCDYVGESLASFFGITTPKYQFEINEYLKIRKAVSVFNSFVAHF